MKNITSVEIENQFTTWLKLDEVILKNSKIIEDVKQKITDQTLIVFTGAGTSGYVGDQLVRYLNPGLKTIKYISYYSTDIVGNPEVLIGGKDILLVSFARSGNSPESCEAVEVCNKYADTCNHLIITCNVEGQLAQSYPQSTIVLPAETNDKGFAMTNSYSSMMITAAKVFGMELKMENIVYEAKRLYTNFPYEKLDQLEYENIVYLSNSENVGLLNELKLKFMELTNGQLGYYSDQFLNFRHGPKSVLTKQTLVVGITSDDEIQEMYESDLYEELIADENQPKVIIFGECIENAEISCTINQKGFARALSVIPVCQNIAVKKSVQLGINPDNPSPSGSVNRVVQGVTIHGREKC